MRRPQRATVVLPAFGVEDAIGPVVRDLASAAHALRARGCSLDLLLLDGGDGVAAATAQDVADRAGLPLTTLVAPPDAGAAFLAGFGRVLGDDAVDLVVTLDATGRHDPLQIPRLVDTLVERDAAVVIGSRWVRGSGTPGLSMARWVLGRLANLAFRRLTGVRRIADATTSFRVVRRETLRDFRFDGVPVSSHSVQTAFVAHAVASGYRVVEAPIIYRQPIAGGGGLRLRDLADFAAHLRGLRASVDQARARRLSPGGRSFSGDHFGAADDLEQLGTAKHFFDWVLDTFDDHLRGRVLEVGAGFGTITRRLHDRYPDLRITALEPAENMFGELESFAALSPRVEALRTTLAEHRPEEAFDAVLYLNVLEHIEDDAGELARAATALRPGGALLVFGPAHEWLYSELDYKAGHYRRYSLRRLGEVTEAAGFEVVSLRYFDVLGVPPYWLVYRLLGHADIAGSSLWGYDRVIVPLSRMIQRLVPHPPLGKNVVLVARRRV